MKKQPFNVMSKAALAGLIGVAGISPAVVVVASAQEEVQLDLDSVVVQTSNGELVELEKTLYNALLDENHVFLNESSFSHVKSTDGTYYERSVFNSAQDQLGDDATVTEVLEFLDNLDQDLSVDIAPAKGSINEDGDVVWEEAVLTSVSAINQTVNKAGTLKFLVNGEEELTAAELAEKYEEQGYTVEFRASADVFAEDGRIDGDAARSSTGELDVTLPNDEPIEFQYEVIISDSEGNPVARSTERGTVIVENQAEIVTSIDRVEVKVAGIESEVAGIESEVIAQGQKATIQVYGYTKDMAADADAVNLTNKADISVSPNALATGQSEGSGEQAVYTITPKENRKGEVTVTIKIAGQEDQVVTLQVTNEARVVDAEQSSVTPESLTLATETEGTVEVTLVDQFGDPVTGKDLDEGFFAVDGLDGGVTLQSVKEDAQNAGVYELTLKADDSAAKGALTIKADNKEIGKVNVEVQEAGDIATWELIPSVEEIDLKGKAQGAKETIKFQFVAKDENNLIVKDADTSNLEIYKRGETDPVADTGYEVNLDDVKAGDVLTFDLYEKTGALLDSLNVTAEVTIVDTTPTIDSVELADPSKVAALKVGDDITKLVKEIVATTQDGDAVETELRYNDDDGVIEIIEKVDEGDAVTLGILDIGNATVKEGEGEEGEQAPITITSIINKEAPVTLAEIKLDGTVVQEKAYKVLAVESVSAITEDGVTTVTATVTGAEEGTEATVEIIKVEKADETEDADETEEVEVVATETVEVDADGNVTATFEGLEAGNYKAVVTVEGVSAESDAFTVEAAEPADPEEPTDPEDPEDSDELTVTVDNATATEGDEEVEVTYTVANAEEALDIDFAVEKADGATIGGATVEDAEDGEDTVTIELDEALVAGEEYTITASVDGEQVADAVLEVVEGDSESDDTTNPEITNTSLDLDEDGNLVLKVKVQDENPFSLEVDHSHGKHGKYAVKNLEDEEWYLKDNEGTPTSIPAIPEFTVYASNENPYGDENAKNAFNSNGVEVEYDETSKEWTITLLKDESALNLINNSISEGAVEFYLVAKDKSGNSSGDMNGNYKTVQYTPES